MLSKIIASIAIVLVLAGAGFFYYTQKFANSDQRILLLTQQKDINGFNVKPELFESPYLIINFWASWCPPCIEETPSLIRFTQQNKEFKLIAISQDDSIADIQNFTKIFPDFKNAGVDVVFDQSRELARNFNVVKLPETFIYNKAKKKYLQISGSTNWADPELLKHIKKEL